MHGVRIHVTMAALLAVAVAAAAITGCESDPVGSAVTGPEAAFEDPSGDAKDGFTVAMTGDAPPPGLVQIGFLGESLTFWPYTGASFDGTPVDPVNLVFVGKADPVRIRAALLALDGDRTAMGFPPVPPFNATWEDAVGDVQVTHAEGDGWTGSVIQLQLGGYDPVRVHLRLFATRHPFGGDGTWCLGAAHFEVRIPGTTTHQVLSWELAEQIVAADLFRSGLLDPALPLMPTGPINAAPSFREIPAMIYNMLPPELQMLTGGPPAPVAADVPLGSDGQGTILHLAGEAPVAPGVFTETVRVDFQQVVPKPFCSDGPFDYVLVAGPVGFQATVRIGADGEYEYESTYRGDLDVTPVDVTSDPPLPVGEPFKGLVTGSQKGRIGDGFQRVTAIDRRVAPQDGGAEVILTRLKVGSEGLDSYRTRSLCLEDAS